MKSLYLFFLGILLLTMHSFAQTPQAINYQGLARGNEGNILINQMVGIRLSIVNDSINGSVVYAETHQRTTDGYGLFALQIGQGSVQTGTFSTIAWGAGNYFLRVEIDASGGSDYILAGTSQFSAVPYALHAKTAENGFSGNYNDLTNQPTLFDGKFSSLSEKPGTVSGYGITDAMTTAHAANAVTITDINNWNDAYSWGTHTGLYRPISYVPDWSEITSNPFAFSSVAHNQQLKYNSATSKWENWTPDYLTSYSETDPIYNAWDKSTGIQITSSQVSDFTSAVTNNSAMLANTAKNSYPDADAAKLSGIAEGAEVNVNADWNAASGDAQILNKPALATVATTGNYNDLNNRPAGTAVGDMLYWNGTTWIRVPVGGNGQTLVLNNGIPVWGGLQLPILNTSVATSLTVSTATGGGNIASDGGSPVTAHGVCWNTTGNPTIANSKTTDGSGTGTFTSNLTGLTAGATYYIRAYATSAQGTAYGNSVGIVQQTGVVSLTTTAVTNIGMNVGTSGGNITSDGGAAVTARGICFATTTNPTISNSVVNSGSGTGSFSADLTGINSNTLYYVRSFATNSTGTYYGNPVSFTTLANTCAVPFTINHLYSGGVAPVNKTVTYTGVTNLPGEPTKCWITQNLGADHQATSVDDGTEASAGWYWQFDRKQGYKYDLGARTPATTWTNTISENADWIAANDPCSLEIGSLWRIPTLTELSNIRSAGNWINWTGPWDSGLKFHAAGGLQAGSGSLYSRGSEGYCWSSTQSTLTYASYLFFYNGNCATTAYNKSYAFTVRCLKVN